MRQICLTFTLLLLLFPSVLGAQQRRGIWLLGADLPFGFGLLNFRASLPTPMPTYSYQASTASLGLQLHGMRTLGRGFALGLYAGYGLPMYASGRYGYGQAGLLLKHYWVNKRRGLVTELSGGWQGLALGAPAGAEAGLGMGFVAFPLKRLALAWTFKYGFGWNAGTLGAYGSDRALGTFLPNQSATLISHTFSLKFSVSYFSIKRYTSGDYELSPLYREFTEKDFHKNEKHRSHRGKRE